MTEQERIDLSALRGEMNSGFAELRGLMETRRVEEQREHGAIYGRLSKVEKVAYAATMLGGIGLLAAAELLHRAQISF